MRNGVGRERAANPNSPARLSPVFNPQKFPSASGALGTRATKGRSLGKINTSSARRLPAFGPGLEGPVSHFVDSASEEKGSPRPEGAGGPRAGGGRPLPAACGFAVGDLLASTCRPAPWARATLGPYQARAAVADTQVPPLDGPGRSQPAPDLALGPCAGRWPPECRARAPHGRPSRPTRRGLGPLPLLRAAGQPCLRAGTSIFGGDQATA